MKIERLTENKIRVIVKPSDLELEKISMKDLLSQSLERQSFLNHMLERAKVEVGFDTDGCRLLIEGFSSSDDILVFTITRYSEFKKSNDLTKKGFKVKRKTFDANSKHIIFKFKNFDDFCEFCEAVNNYNCNITKISKNSTLYLYNNTYYLIINNINLDINLIKKFYSLTSEFYNSFYSSSEFESKLIEHAKVIMKKNAISNTINYFINPKEKEG